jgi:hypothetical protein
MIPLITLSEVAKELQINVKVNVEGETHCFLRYGLLRDGLRSFGATPLLQTPECKSE